ncbi:putative nucleotide kinase [Salinarchaeum sp. Harcht-Bsk1]|uniref:adenylate kinase family protein n=1 Tax=Salinarchaeum sp. Harcht-Bsk1 TaxID=1333523 RepID=UPI0003423DF3|nr:adenylate kinase family protein [Salinarchaeum sp. Harcht-Bsk1]AGN02093.1 putative nucleotide kinase [Salinarchaeum sp. Harcht-Bsk1]
MRVAVTGTPGTGKTSAVDALEGSDEGVPNGLEVVHLNEVIEPEGLYEELDEERDSLVVDFEAIADFLADREHVLIESHLAHHLDVDRVIVLRCAPEELERRLEQRGEDDPSRAESDASIAENAESEALDVILAEAVDRHGRDAVYEIETTDRTPSEVAGEIRAAILGDREPSAGTVDYTDYF